MANQVEEIKRKIQERRRKKLNQSLKERSQPQFYHSHDEARGEPDFYFASDVSTIQEPEEKMFRKDILIMQILISVCLFLIIGIIFKVENPQLDRARNFVQNSFEQEFQFASVANWYENQFGKPLALLPNTSDIALDNLEPSQSDFAYAVPAGGRVAQNFDKDGQGVIIETSNSMEIEAAKAGMVRFVSEEETLGKTVIVAHYDGGESWYAMLDHVEVKLYDHIKVGQKIGTATKSEETDNGIYYFAIKEGETFINPIDVIPFE